MPWTGNGNEIQRLFWFPVLSICCLRIFDLRATKIRIFRRLTEKAGFQRAWNWKSLNGKLFSTKLRTRLGQVFESPQCFPSPLWTRWLFILCFHCKQFSIGSFEFLCLLAFPFWSELFLKRGNWMEIRKQGKSGKKHEIKAWKHFTIYLESLPASNRNRYKLQNQFHSSSLSTYSSNSFPLRTPDGILILTLQNGKEGTFRFSDSSHFDFD